MAERRPHSLMKLRLLALLLAPAALLAQSDPEMPANLFFDTDFVTVVPKWTMQYGVRGLTGASTKFGGTGYVESVQAHGEFTDKGIALLRRFLERQLKAVADGGDPAGVSFDPGAAPVDFEAGNFLV